MKRITDPDFVYIPSACTDIKKTFERVRQEQALNQSREAWIKEARKLGYVEIQPKRAPHPNV